MKRVLLMPNASLMKDSTVGSPLNKALSLVILSRVFEDLRTPWIGPLSLAGDTYRVCPEASSTVHVFEPEMLLGVQSINC